MITWLVMQINELMFQPIDSAVRYSLQVVSFIEVFAEMILLIVLIVFLIGKSISDE